MKPMKPNALHSMEILFELHDITNGKIDYSGTKTCTEWVHRKTKAHILKRMAKKWANLSGQPGIWEDSDNEYKFTPDLIEVTLSIKLDSDNTF